ncbi:ribonuclease H-like domain-containing protein [Sporosarcina gallistercoris]|uniref:Ribonuclease H-like domain-containing protein n=1 Tax=Sporosarcina gallistercoris TaxID=2762245 RepID=A0ABR8PFG6_9BACL|nr:ribonuclease H-like domain-containing protein [Sporosarcina gallistercoris]MBD7906920.1 ribonuclease H-like domain-containing protein [Sporosarcina gallistercoris]
MSYEQNLMKMKGMLKKTESVTSAPKETQGIAQASSPSYESQWLAAGLEKETNLYGTVYKKIVDYDETYTHGKYQLNELTVTLQKWKSSGERHPLAPDPDKKLLFFDTETTGLKGTGTLIFLIGLIEQRGNGFRMTQYVLPGPAHEAAFLYATGLWEKPVTLVMYNGKSFDMPQLDTRWTMNRNLLPPLPKHDQIDLLHGSRRIWKHEMESFKLPAVEEEQLGFVREDDMPGHLAPIIYQDAVKNGRAEMLMKILLHNELDILSLVTLYIRSTELLLQEELSGTAVSQTNIGKWYADLKSHSRAAIVLEQVIEEYGTQHPTTHFHFGFLLKKNGKYKEALEAFGVCMTKSAGRERIIALEEMAKIHEHKNKDCTKALQLCGVAKGLLSRDSSLTASFSMRMIAEFTKREMRLKRKLFPGQAQDSTK